MPSISRAQGPLRNPLAETCECQESYRSENSLANPGGGQELRFLTRD